jgi:L-rhamnose mutarotase
MPKTAFKMKLKSGCKEEYKKRHNKIWPELLDLLKENGVRDYSIFYDEETDFLFAVHQQERRSSQELGKNKIMQRWWAYMADIMETNYDNSPVTKSLENVFQMD